MLSINNVIVERIFAWNKVIYGTSPNRSRWKAVGLDEMAGWGNKGAWGVLCVMMLGVEH